MAVSSHRDCLVRRVDSKFPPVPTKHLISGPFNETQVRYGRDGLHMVANHQKLEIK